MGEESGVESQLPAFTHRNGESVVDHRGRHHADSGVSVLVVVPGKEGLAERACILDTAETIGKLGAVFHGAEMAFRVGVVVGGVRPAVGFGDAEIGQQQSHGFPSHGRAKVGMNSQGVGLDVLLGAGFREKKFGQFGGFARSQHPAHDVTAEDIQHYVKIEVGPFDGTAQFGDVPAPQLIGIGGQQFGLPVLRMDELVAAFADRAILFEHPIHGPNGAYILAGIQQSSVDGGGSAILEAFGIQYGKDAVALAGSQRAGRWGPCRRLRNRHRHRRSEQRTAPVEGCPGDTERVTSRFHPDGGGQLRDGIH